MITLERYNLTDALGFLEAAMSAGLHTMITDDDLGDSILQILMNTVEERRVIYSCDKAKYDMMVESMKHNTYDVNEAFASVVETVSETSRPEFEPTHMF